MQGRSLSVITIVVVVVLAAIEASAQPGFGTELVKVLGR